MLRRVAAGEWRRAEDKKVCRVGNASEWCEGSAQRGTDDNAQKRTGIPRGVRWKRYAGGEPATAQQAVVIATVHSKCHRHTLRSPRRLGTGGTRIVSVLQRRWSCAMSKTEARHVIEGGSRGSGVTVRLQERHNEVMRGLNGMGVVTATRRIYNGGDKREDATSAANRATTSA